MGTLPQEARDPLLCHGPGPSLPGPYPTEGHPLPSRGPLGYSDRGSREFLRLGLMSRNTSPRRGSQAPPRGPRAQHNSQRTVRAHPGKAGAGLKTKGPSGQWVPGAGDA